MPGGLPLIQTPFQDMLPTSISRDPQILAAAQALDEIIPGIDAQIDNALIWSRIEQLEEPLLSNLAYQLHLEGYEGWQLAETLEQKRRLVESSIILHFHKGTRYSLERIFEILNMRGNITEWWESDEPIEDFPPYTFDIDIEATRSIDEQFYIDVMSLISALKNARSHLRKGRVSMTAKGKVPVVGSALIGGFVMTVYPFHWNGGEVRARIPVVAATLQAGLYMTLLPYKRNA